LFWWVLVALGVLIGVLGVISTGARAQASTRKIAHLLAEPTARSAA
jgi:hypothetical protein